MKNVLIIGGNGNIGYALAQECLNAGYHVTCFNRALSGPCPDGVELIKGNRSELANYKAAISSNKRDLVIDLVCFNRSDAEIGYHAFRDSGHYIHCSSVATYGRNLKRIPTTEDDPLLPENGYGKGKRDADYYFMSRFFETGFPVTIVKPSISYSARFGLLRQIGMDMTWISRIMAGKPILVSGDGNSLHQFMHVEDVSRAIMSLAFRSESIGNMYNIVPLEPVSWNYYHRTAMDVLGRHVSLIGVPKTLLLKEASRLNHQLSDIFAHNSFFSGAKLSNISGYSPSLSLYKGIEQVIGELIKNDKVPRLPLNSWEDEVIAKYSSSVIA